MLSKSPACADAAARVFRPDANGAQWRSRNRQQKFVVANADEGDPGAYIDRFLMEDDPHALIEGMLLAGYAVGASKGWIYLRNEYPRAEAILREAIAEARAAGLLGERVLGRDFAFDVELVVGHGSYVCGEETALIRSIEGRRPRGDGAAALPDRTRFVWETDADQQRRDARERAVDCRAWRRSVPRARVLAKPRHESRVAQFAVRSPRPLRDRVRCAGAAHCRGTRRWPARWHAIQGVIIGGPLAGIIPPHLFDTPFGFEELHAIGASVGHGGIVAFDEHTSIPELVDHVFSFGAYESCGKCTPCRIGSRRIEEIFRDAS